MMKFYWTKAYHTIFHWLPLKAKGRIVCIIDRFDAFFLTYKHKHIKNEHNYCIFWQIHLKNILSLIFSVFEVEVTFCIATTVNWYDNQYLNLDVRISMKLKKNKNFMFDIPNEFMWKEKIPFESPYPPYF